MSCIDPSQRSICTLHCKSVRFSQYASKTNTSVSSLSMQITCFARLSCFQQEGLINQVHHKNTVSPSLRCRNIAYIEGTLDVGKFSFIGFSFHIGISLRQITCNLEVIVKYSSISLPHPVMVFGRDALILIQDNTLLRSFRIVT